MLQGHPSWPRRPVDAPPLWRDGDLRVAIGLTAIGAPLLFTVTDLIEFLNGGYFPLQMLLSYLAELPTALFVLGLYALQWPRMGRVGLVGAASFALAYVFFAATALLALTSDLPNWEALAGRLGLLLPIHGTLLWIGGLLFGWAVIRAGVLPRWTGAALMLGMALRIAAVALGLPLDAMWLGALVQNIAFLAMGAAVVWGKTSAPEPDNSRKAARGSEA